MPTTLDRLKGFGATYRRIRNETRYGWILRYVTIVFGFAVTVVGAITIPYPGPGWALVFLGLLILSEELEWAARLRRYLMGKLNHFYSTYIDGNRLAQAALAIGTCAIVLATLWVTGAADTAQQWIGLDYPWLASPLFG